MFRPRNEKVMLGAPKIVSVDGIYAGEFITDRYSGTWLLAVLNIKDFNCLERLSTRLSYLRARSWADLTSQPDPVMMRAALFCSFSSFWLRPLPIYPHTALQQSRCGRISDLYIVTRVLCGHIVLAS